MPGLIGFAGLEYNSEARNSIISKMMDQITYNDRHTSNGVFLDEKVSCGRICGNVINEEVQPFLHNGLYIWLDGELYNQEQIISKEKIEADTDMEILIKCYCNNSNFNFLQDIDGIYSAVIYDSINKKVHLITDRYGYRYLFWSVQNGCLVWGSELKIMLEMPFFKPQIDEQAVKEFIHIGFILRNRTWFKGVELLPTGTVLSWDIREKKKDVFRYWWWDKITPYTGKENENELSEEAGRLFINAVKKRCKGPGKVGIPLSGGLDSRFVLAAMPDCGYPLETITFGQRDSVDILLARKAAKIKGVKHHEYYIDSENWLQNRLEGIWRTDGLKNMYHMHLIDAQSAMQGLFDIALNGIGSATISDAYISEFNLGEKRKEFDKPIKKNFLARCYHVDEDLLGDISEFENLNKYNYFFLENESRRFSNEGIRLSSTFVHNRMPFFDNDFVEFVLALPEAMKYNWSFYFKVLLKTYPDYFDRIAWSHTGMPISCSGFLAFSIQMQKKVKRKLNQTMCRFGYKHPLGIGICNYPELIKQEPAGRFYQKLLFNPSALYKHYIDEEMVVNDWNQLMNRTDRSDMLCRYLTFEIWLQQVFNNQYKKWEDA